MKIRYYIKLIKATFKSNSTLAHIGLDFIHFIHCSTPFLAHYLTFLSMQKHAAAKLFIHCNIFVL